MRPLSVLKLGREFSQEAFEFMGEEPGWGSALGKLPKIEVLKDVLNHTRLFDHRDDLKAGSSSPQVAKSFRVATEQVW